MQIATLFGRAPDGVPEIARFLFGSKTALAM